MTRLLTVIVVSLTTLSWIAAGIVGLAVVGIGIYTVVDGALISGLAIIVFAAPFAFMTAQTIIGVLAVPFGMALENRDDGPNDPDWEPDDAWT